MSNTFIEILKNKQLFTYSDIYYLVRPNITLQTGISPHQLDGFGDFIGLDQVYRFLKKWQTQSYHFTCQVISPTVFKLSLPQQDIHCIIEIEMLDKISNINMYWSQPNRFIESLKKLKE